MNQLSLSPAEGIGQCLRGQGPWMAILFGTMLAPDAWPPADRQFRQAEGRCGLGSGGAHWTRSGSGWRNWRGRRWLLPAEPWMAERRQLRTSEGLEGRSECPATGHGHPDPHWTLVSPFEKNNSPTPATWGGTFRAEQDCHDGLFPRAARHRPCCSGGEPGRGSGCGPCGGSGGGSG